jgi:predicted dehydrogenase
MRTLSSDEGWSGPTAHEIVAAMAPKGSYRAAVVGCGRMGSTIDDEHVGKPHYPWPWAHAPAIIEARGVELVAGVDLDPDRLADFGRRWGVTALYADLREMVAKERPDIVCVTTRSAERAQIVIALAEAGVRAVYATKPISRTLAEADAMIKACRSTGTILAIAAHLNWYAPYTSAKALIDSGEIGPMRSVVCLSPFSLSNMHSHTLCLFRLFAGAPARWVFGHMDSDEATAGDEDLGGSGFIGYDNGMLGIMNSHAPRRTWAFEFNCERGRVVSRNAHAWFELWGQEDGESGAVQRQFPYPWRPRSSMVDAIEGVARSIEGGVEETCPGEFGREALEIAIALRESHRRGGVRIELPLGDRGLSLG